MRKDACDGGVVSLATEGLFLMSLSSMCGLSHVCMHVLYCTAGYCTAVAKRGPDLWAFNRNMEHMAINN